MSTILCLFLFNVGTQAQPYYCAEGRHRDILAERVPPTETQNGFETFQCELCGREYTAILFATAHIWSAWRIDRQSTCTEPGQRRRTCTTHTPHDEIEELPPLGHDFVLSTQEPTCEAAGLQVYTCTRCGYIRTEPGEPALGHDYELTARYPTCTENGLRTYICTRCDSTRTAPGGSALGHDFVLTAQEPICGEAGTKTYTCVRCGYTYAEPGQPAIGHSFGEWHIDVPAEIGHYGLEVRACVHCGRREERAIPALYQYQTPLFNEIDAVAGGISLSLLIISLFLLLPCIITISREKVAYKAYLKRKQLAQLEDKKYGFH